VAAWREEPAAVPTGGPGATTQGAEMPKRLGRGADGLVILSVESDKYSVAWGIPCICWINFFLHFKTKKSGGSARATLELWGRRDGRPAATRKPAAAAIKARATDRSIGEVEGDAPPDIRSVCRLHTAGRGGLVIRMRVSAPPPRAHTFTNGAGVHISAGLRHPPGPRTRGLLHRTLVCKPNPEALAPATPSAVTCVHVCGE